MTDTDRTNVTRLTEDFWFLTGCAHVSLYLIRSGGSLEDHMNRRMSRLTYKKEMHETTFLFLNTIVFMKLLKNLGFFHVAFFLEGVHAKFARLQNN